jgi:hypothetical protein
MTIEEKNIIKLLLQHEAERYIPIEKLDDLEYIRLAKEFILLDDVLRIIGKENTKTLEEDKTRIILNPIFHSHIFHIEFSVKKQGYCVLLCEILKWLDNNYELLTYSEPKNTIFLNQSK